ncbi:glycoside hydrolase family 18 protein [Aquimarina longa]|uniref:glycoside hydrolase family 18 protein n=1 Tax=Aquimarina longa TaxID=1080221 RepID=UPI00078541C4|nr:glycoside hydrolase family 18 protein [Aquimarina longa]
MKTDICILLFFTIIFMNSCKNKNSEDIKGVINSPIHTVRLRDTLVSDYKFTTEQQWDSINGVSIHSTPMPLHAVRKDYKTFGWHIFSKGSAYKSYNFSLLWGVSYFSYVVNAETGSYSTIHQWKTTALVDSAKVKNCKVFLSVSNFGAKRNALFLKNPKAQKTLADSLSVLLSLRKADGINIDFEGVSSANRKQFSDFIIRLSMHLHNKNPDYQISLALYAVDYHKIFDIKTIDSVIDFYTLMGYDYYGGFSKHAGPVSPLKSSKVWGTHSIESSVDYYIKEGVALDKLIVGLPYYGDQWQTKSTTIPSEVKKFLSHNTYSDIKKIFGFKKYKLHFDTMSTTRYGVYEKDDMIQQLWFDDSLSLSYKYDWIKEKKLSGVGIWALGYDHGTTELWELIANKFGKKE